MTDKFSVLIISIIGSVLAIITFDIDFTGSYNAKLDIYRIIGPGIFFTLFTIYVKLRFELFKIAILKAGLIFALWIAAYYLGFASYGFGFTFIGAANGYLMGRILFGKEVMKENMWYYILFGAIAGLIGNVLFYTMRDLLDLGFNMIWVIILWQFGIGYLIINETQQPTIKETVD